MTEEEIFSKPIRAVPSANVAIPNGKPVTYSLITEDYVGLAHGLEKCVADRFAALHNKSL